jgi:nicotinamide phosphoribosyltransferase
MQVYRDPSTGRLALKDQCTWEEEGKGELRPVFRDGKLLVDETLEGIRGRVRENLKRKK